MARLLSRRLLIIVAVVIVVIGAVLVGLDLSGVFATDHVRTTDQPIPAPVAGNGPTGPMHRLWSVRATGLAPDGGQVLTSTTTHDLTALDAHTGAVRWSDTRGTEWRLWGVAIADSVVVAEFEGAKGVALVGLDEAHGTKLWDDDGLSLGPDDYLPTRLDVSVVAGKTVYANSIGDGGVATVVALDPRTGDTRWQTSLGPGCLGGGPAFMAGQLGVVEAMSCGKPGAITDHTTLIGPDGRIRWRRDLTPPRGGDNHANLALGMGPGMVVVQSLEGPWVAYSATGDVVAQCLCTAPTIAQPPDTVAAGLVLDTGSLPNAQHITVTAYDANTGRQRWVSGMTGTPYAGVDGDVITDGSRLFYHTLSVSEPLLELDPATGSVRATYPVAGVRPGNDEITAAAIDGGAYLVWQSLEKPDELTAYAS